MIPDEEVERIREMADIVAIIGESVDLRRAGADFRGPCPFHQGTHRNFSVSQGKKRYYCFVCHERGDAFSFLQKRLGVDWPTAVRMVAAKSGTEVREVTRKVDGPDPRAPLWEANSAAAEYFQRMLWEGEQGKAAQAYLATRGVTREVAENFGLGFAPREIGLLRSHLTTLGIAEQTQLEAGLLSQRTEDEEPRPRLRDRLTFPILDLAGHVVGFGGRIIGAGEPKYLNSPESPIFAKGQLLYHLTKARLAARREDRLVVVEGYFDVVSVVSAGVEPVVAPLGTALTAEQAKLITRYSKNVFLLYDSDTAGLKATFRSGDVLLAHGASVRVASLPPGEDPDSFARKAGRTGLEKALQQAVDVFDLRVRFLERAGWFADLQRRRRAIDRLLPTIRATADPVMRDIYVGRTAEVSGVARAILLQEAAHGAQRQSRAGPSADHPAAPDATSDRSATAPRRTRPPRGPGISAERELVRAMLSNRTVVERVAERIGPASFHEARYRDIFNALLDHGPDVEVAELAEALEVDGAVEVLESLLGELDAIQHLEQTVEHSLARLEERRLEERNREIDALMPMAHGDEQDRLVEEKESNRREIARLRETREFS